MSNATTMYTLVGTGLAEAGLPRLVVAVATAPEFVGTGECALLDGRGRPVLRFPLPEDAVIYAWRPEGLAPWPHGAAQTEAVRAAAERYARREFDGGIRFAALGELWTGPLCLTHGEAVGLLREALATGPDSLKFWAVYLAEEYSRVEEGRDALAAGDWTAFAEIAAESHGAYAAATGREPLRLGSVAAWYAESDPVEAVALCRGNGRPSAPGARRLEPAPL